MTLLALIVLLDTSGRVDPGSLPWPAEKVAPFNGGPDAYSAPVKFQAGAARFRQGSDPFEIPKDAAREFRALLRSSHGSALRSFRPARHLQAVINGVLSDDERTAKRSMQLLYDFCAAFKLATESGRNPINLDMGNWAQWRGGLFAEWHEWYQTNAEALKDGK